MALLNLGEDPWLVEYESCEKLHRDIMEQLMERERLPRTTDKHSHLSATIRLRLKQYTNEVTQLKQKLEVTTHNGSITAAEAERRTRQVELLYSKSVQMQKMFNSQVYKKMNEDRNQLIGASGTSWDENPSTTYTTDQLREDQRRILGEQEQGLESLAQIISRQKNIAHTISDEVDLHNDILDDLGTHIDQTDARVHSETRHITEVSVKDKTCFYWVVIILLFLSIVVVAAI